MKKQFNPKNLLIYLLLYGLNLYIFALPFYSTKVLAIIIFITYLIYIRSIFNIIDDILLNKIYLMFLLGIIISITAAMIRLGSYSEISRLMKFYGTSLPHERLLLAIPLVGVIQCFFNREEKILLFLRSVVLFTFFVILSIRFGISGTGGSVETSKHLQLIGERTIENVGGFLYARETFGFLDTNVYAQILSIVIVIAVFLYSISEYKITKLYLILFLLLALHSLLKTASQSGLIQTIISIIVLLNFMDFEHKRTLKGLSVIGAIVFIFVIFTLNIDPFIAIKERLLLSYDVIENLLLGSWQFTSSDTFTFRIVAGVYAIEDVSGIILSGTGGYTTGFVGTSSNHIDYLIWVTQYGLVTALPLFLFLILIFKRNFAIRRNILKLSFDKFYINLSTLGFVIILNVALTMMINPTGYYMFIWPSISLSIYLILRNKIREYTTN